MALLVPTQVKLTGATVTPEAADAAGDTFRPGKGLTLLVGNASASSMNVTVAVPGNAKYTGVAAPDVVRAVAAGATEGIGPFPNDLADPADGLVHVTYSATASVTRRLIRN